MKKENKNKKQLLEEIEELQIRLKEAEETLSAIRSGEVDAIVVSGPQGEQVFTLTGAERAYRVLIEAMNEGAASLNQEGLIIYCNQRLSEMIKTPLEKVIGTPMRQFIRASDLPVFDSLIEKGLQENGKGEIAFIKNDGTVLPVLLSISAFNANRCSIIVTDLTAQKHIEKELRRHRDNLEELVKDRTNELETSNQQLREEITERKRAEESLRESERRYRLITENLSDVIWTMNLDGKFTYVSPTTFRLHGYTADAVMRQPLEERVTPDSRPLVLDTLKTLFEKGRQGIIGPPVVVELEYLRKDGSTVWAEVSMELVKDQASDSLMILGVTRNIAERKRAEAEHKRLMAAIEQVGETVLITDPGGAIQYVNPVFETVTGYTRKEALGQNPRILRSGQQDEAFYRELWETISAGRTWQGRMVNKRKDGKLYTEEATISPVCDAAGRIVNYVAVKHDITEHLRLAGQFQQAQKLEAVGRLTGGIAHDFNNLLTIIIGNADMAIAEVGKEAPIYEFLEDIKGAGERAAGLTRQLLVFSRKQVLQFEVVNLNETVGEIDKMLRRIIGEDIELETVLAPDLGWVEADIGQFEQVIMNLAVNARDAMPGGGKLTIETANVELDEAYARNHVAVVPGPYVMLSVSDTGIGMSPEVQAQVFEPFFTTKAKGTGTGLGLSTVYGIVKQSRGNIWVYSEVGRGTSFKIYLPRVEKSGGGEKGNGARIEARGGTETVLVVEDEDKVRNLAVRVLSRYGYKVLTAGDGQEAVEILKGHEGPIHLLLTDVVMPGMSGGDLAKSLERLRPEIKVLFMSGYTDNAIVHHGILDKRIAFIQKPFTPKDLARKVRETLDQED